MRMGRAVFGRGARRLRIAIAARGLSGQEQGRIAIPRLEAERGCRGWRRPRGATGGRESRGQVGGRAVPRLMARCGCRAGRRGGACVPAAGTRGAIGAGEGGGRKRGVGGRG